MEKYETFSRYFRHRGEFFRLVNAGQINTDLEEHRDLLRAMLMTASDVSAITKPWEVQKRVRELHDHRH